MALNPASPLSIVNSTETVPWTVKLNGFSSSSLVAKLTWPLNTPDAAASRRTVKVVVLAGGERRRGRSLPPG